MASQAASDWERGKGWAISTARNLGFLLDRVWALLERTGDLGSHRALVDERATGHLTEIDRKIADLTALRRKLAALLTSCHGGSVSDCRILEAFGSRPSQADELAGDSIKIEGS